MMHRYFSALTGVAVATVIAFAATAPVRAQVPNVVLLEDTLPPVARDMVTRLVSAADGAGAPHLDVQIKDVSGAEVAVASGAYAVTAVPVYRLAEHVRAIDLFSLPFLFNNADNQASILARNGIVRQSFDTSTVDFGVRVLALLPVGYEGLAFTGTIAAHPEAMTGLRVLTDGPSERGFVAATSGIPIRKGRHGSAVVAPWEVLAAEDLYHAYFDLREAPSLIALVINEAVWRDLAEDEKAAWNAAAEDAEATAQADLDRLHDAHLAWMRRRGVDVVSVTATEREVWRAATAGLARASYLGESHKLGRAFLHEVDKLQASR